MFKSQEFSRRRFLRAATATVAVPCFVPRVVLGGPDNVPPSERITTALLGCGQRGQQIMGGAEELVAACDADANHLTATKAKIDARRGTGACATYRDFREALGHADLDAVLITAPDHWHVPMALAAIKAGKAVYVEKPLTLTIHEGRLLVAAVRRYGAILQVGSQQRSDEKFIRACELVRNGRLGELKSIRVDIPTRAGSDQPWTPQPVPPELDYELWLGPAPWAPYHPDRCHYKFRFVSDYSGGDVSNWGAHQLDIAQWALDADNSGPIHVAGTGKRNQGGLHDVFYDVDVEFTYANGVKVHLRSGGNSLRFEGTEGMVFVSRGRLQAEPANLLTAPLGSDAVRLWPEGVPEDAPHMGVRRSDRGIPNCSMLRRRWAIVRPRSATWRTLRWSWAAH
jgi:predicted dehydrogenase